MTLERPNNIQSLEDLGLRLEDSKTLLAEIQSMLVDQQFEQDQEAPDIIKLLQLSTFVATNPEMEYVDNMANTFVPEAYV